MRNEEMDKQAEAIFAEAIELDSADAREAHVLGATANQDALARRVRELLLAHEKAGGFMKTSDPDREHDPDHTRLSHTLMKTPLSEGPGTMIGRYKLLEKIGEGGFGSVYMAEQKEPVKRRVALKIIKLGMDTEQVVARFEAERQALALMDHPSIARVLDAGATETGRPYFVMELVKGMPITQFCDDRNLRTADRLRLFRDVCAAVHHAHQKGVIHRDLKPSNILVTLHGDQPIPKVIDFGIAKATQQQLTEKTVFTQFAQFIGTPAYMSPEQAAMSGFDVDTRSDVYSLGVLLYELLTGKTPVDQRSMLSAGYEEICRIIREEEPPPPSTRLSSMAADELTLVARQRGATPKKLGLIIPSDLDWVVMKALEKDRTRRYESAHGFAQDIDRYLNDEPVAAMAPTSLYRFRKFFRRHRKVVSLAASIVILLVAGVTVSSWQAIRATRAERLAAQMARQEKEAREAEAVQRRNAEDQRRIAEETLYRLRYETADDLIAKGETAAGLAALARLLRDNPDNPTTATRLMSALRRRSFALPIESIPLEEPVSVACIHPDGNRLMTASPEGTIRVWDLQTGHIQLGPIQSEAAVNGALFSPRGRYLAFWSADHTVRVLDSVTGLLKGAVIRHTGPVLGVRFSASGDRLVTGSVDGTARIWTATSSSEPGVVTTAGWIKWAEFSPDETRVATASHGNEVFKVQVWNRETGEQVFEIASFQKPVQCVRFSPDGDLLATASNNGMIQFWNARTGEAVLEPIRHPDGFGFFRVNFSPEGNRILTVSILEKAARVWDLATGRPLTPSMRHKDRLYFADWSLDGRRVITGSHDQTARVWDSSTGQPITEPIRHAGMVNAASFIPNTSGGKILTTSSNRRAHIWEVRPGGERAIVVRHEEGLYTARFSRDEMRFVTASADGSARVWDANSGRLAAPALAHESTEAHPGNFYVFNALFNADATRVLTAATDATARVWNSRTGEIILRLDTKTEFSVRRACFGPDEQRIATGSDDGTFRIWHARTGELMFKPVQVAVAEPMDFHPITTVTFSPDGEMLLTSAADNAARLWGARTGEPIGNTMLHDAWVSAAEFSPDGNRILTASEDRTARLWDAKTGAPIGLPFQHDDGVTSAVFGADGERVVTASKDRTARIWDATTGEPIGVPCRHDGPVWMARLSADGRSMATASEDGTARVWDALIGLPLSEPLRHDGPVTDVQFTADANRILTASDDGTARVWFVPTARARENDPVPDWLPDWAEAVANLRFDEANVPVFVPSERLGEVRRRIVTSVESDLYTKIGKWFFMDRADRSIFLGSTLTNRETPEL